MINETTVAHNSKECQGHLKPVRDSLDILNGKWTVYDTLPVTVEYSITPYGLSLKKVIDELRIWGVQHRKRVMKK